MNTQIKESLLKEISINAIRSSGPGGQNVNKVNTKVELRFNIFSSTALSPNEKIIIEIKLGNRINESGDLIITDQSTRSQLKNKQAVKERFIDLIEQALKPRKKRIATKPTKSSKLKRIENKKRLAAKKQLRKKNF